MGKRYVTAKEIRDSLDRWAKEAVDRAIQEVQAQQIESYPEDLVCQGAGVVFASRARETLMGHDYVRAAFLQNYYFDKSNHHNEAEPIEATVEFSKLTVGLAGEMEIRYDNLLDMDHELRTAMREVGHYESRCVCGDPTAEGVVHRMDGPCYDLEQVPGAVVPPGFSV